MNVYLVEFNGYYLGGSMIIVDETQLEAFNKAKDRISSMMLDAENKDFSLDNVKLISCDATRVIVVDGGNY